MAFNYPEPLEYLITALKQLPGVGRRGAERMALNMTQWDSEKLRELGALLIAIPQTLTPCPMCGACAENGKLCPVCSDPRRITEQLCIVENLSQLLAVENSGHYHGRYWVLGGKISPLDSENRSGLNLSGLTERVESGKIKEVILALSSDVEGRATAWFIADLLKNAPITISQPALGLPAGSNITFADGATIAAAFGGRTKINQSNNNG